MRNPDVFARRVFFWAGIYGLIVLLPQYLIELRKSAVEWQIHGEDDWQ